MNVSDYDLLVRSIGNQATAAFILLVVLLTGNRVARAACTRECSFFRSDAGFGLTGMFLKNIGDCIKSSWTFYLQVEKIKTGAIPDSSWYVVLIAGYLAPALTIVGSLMLVRAFVPESWKDRRQVGALAAVILLLYSGAWL